MSGNAFLVVRSVVEHEADRSGFDHWYQTDHMPKAIRLLGAETGWRFWSRTDPSGLVAEQHAEGAFDLIAIGRGLLAEPEWANKVRDGRVGDIRPLTRAAYDTLVI